MRWMESTGHGRVRRSRTLYCTHREADEWLAAKHVKVGSDSPMPTVRQAYEMWALPIMARNLSPRTLAGYRQH